MKNNIIGFLILIYSCTVSLSFVFAAVVEETLPLESPTEASGETLGSPPSQSPKTIPDNNTQRDDVRLKDTTTLREDLLKNSRFNFKDYGVMQGNAHGMATIISSYFYLFFRFIGFFLLISFLILGYRIMTSQEQDGLAKAKTNLIRAGIGMFFIYGSYVLIVSILQIVYGLIGERIN